MDRVQRVWSGMRNPVHRRLLPEKLSFKIEKPIAIQDWDTPGEYKFCEIDNL